MKRNLRLCLAAVLLCGSAVGTAHAANPAFSGFWELTARKAPAPPQLTRTGAALKAKTKVSGDVDAEAARWCVAQGMPYVMTGAGPIDIIAAPRELVITAEKIAVPRHIYTDGQVRPDLETFDTTPVGDTRGRWQGDEVVAETIGMSAGVGPAGAPRTEASRVVERFKVTGNVLTISATWTDKSVLKGPYRYTLTYRRLPASYTAPEHYCDPRDNGVGHP